MSEQSHEHHDKVSEEELLANAIPIDINEAEENDQTDHDAQNPAPIELEEGASSVVGSNKIRTFDTRKPHVDHWKRTPNVTGQGAIHVKTFVSKLRLDAIDHLDEQINNWLDNHPEYEVKFVSQSIGKLVGKNTEDALFVSVWV
ncbi:MAG: hypothetical protein Kow00105_08380 [Phycisphaeraceae bacterium]